MISLKDYVTNMKDGQECIYFIAGENMKAVKSSPFIETLEKKAQPCPGSMEVLEKLYAEKKYGLAVVSSSALPRVQLNKL